MYQGSQLPPASESDTGLGTLLEGSKWSIGQEILGWGECGYKGNACMEFGNRCHQGPEPLSAFVFTANERRDQDEYRGEFFKNASLRNVFLTKFLTSLSQSIFSPYRPLRNISTNLKTFPL